MISQTAQFDTNAVDTLHWNLEALSNTPAQLHPPQDIRNLVRSIEQLPPLPEMAKRLLRLLDDPDADAPKLAQIIELDPMLATQILRWANSAYYGLPKPITSVRDAITRTLGYDQAASLALGLATLSPLRIPDHGAIGMNAVWRHGALCSRLMLALQALLPAEMRPSTGSIHLAGLTQNIGYLLLSHLLPAQFAFLNRLLQRNPSIPLLAAESFALGLDHTQLGHWLLEAWDMPRSMQTAVRHHHNPAYTGIHRPLVCLTCLADGLASHTPSGLGPARPDNELAEIAQRLDIDLDEGKNIIKQLD